MRYFNTVDNRSFEPVDFYLGDIGTDDVWDVVNLLGPLTDPVGPLSTPNGATVLFFATQGGEDKIWLYRGLQEQVGISEPPTVEADFRLFPEDGQTDPPPTFQETIPQEANFISSEYVFHLDNHEGQYYFMNEAKFQDSFRTMRLKLGGFTRALIDTDSETAYPVVENKWLIELDVYVIVAPSGTATVSIDTDDYLMTFDTDIETTLDNFVTDHATDILADNNLTVYRNSNNELEFDGLVSPTITISNTTGTLDGIVKTIPAVLINTPPFSEALFDMFVEYDGQQINYWFRPRVYVGVGSTAPASKTGTAIVFTENALYNEDTYLTSGNLTLSLTGAKKGVVTVVYCNGYAPTISGEDYLKSAGNLDASSLNILSFFYDGKKILLNIGNISVLIPPTLSLTPGDTEMVINWGAIPNATNYVIQRATDSGFTTGLTEVYNGALLTDTDTGLTNGTTYYYRGKAQGKGYIESPWSATESAAPTAGGDAYLIAEWDASVGASVTTANGAVTLWEDQTANGNDLSESTKTPTHSTVNNRITFAGVDASSSDVLKRDIPELDFQQSDDFTVLIKGLFVSSGAAGGHCNPISRGAIVYRPARFFHILLAFLA